jgi:hypothetical protein
LSNQTRDPASKRVELFGRPLTDRATNFIIKAAAPELALESDAGALAA